MTVADPPGCSATGCGWYHGAWPLLRSLGLVATPQRHAEFFDRAIGAVAEAGATEVLVTGAADPAMATVVLDAYRTRGVEPAITVLDRCATPVDVACAALPGITAWVADIFTVDGPARFDLLCTHGLFPMVPADRRAELAERWASLLVPGGRLVTTTSLAGPDAEDPVVFDADAVAAFVERAVDAARQADPESVDVPVEEVAAVARAWASRAAIHPVRAIDDVTSVLEAAGFETSVDEREVTGPIGGSGGPWSARSAVYGEIVATRR